MTLRSGQAAPDFELPNERGEPVRLQAQRGKKVVLFFYPKDDTPGCTKESCEFRDYMGDFGKKNAVVFGISADDEESHQAFKSKFHLNFPLLADTDKTVCRAYGVWGPQEWQGKKFEGIGRTTYVIDEKGMIARVYEKVNPGGHAQEVLNQL